MSCTISNKPSGTIQKPSKGRTPNIPPITKAKATGQRNHGDDLRSQFNAAAAQSGSRFLNLRRWASSFGLRVMALNELCLALFRQP
jgi:hypothetical protein